MGGGGEVEVVVGDGGEEGELPGRLERSKSGLAAMVDSVITTFGDMEVNDITFDHA